MNHEQRIRFVFDTICQYKLDHDGNSPTRDELVAIVHINKTGLHMILRVLEARNLIHRESNRNKAGKIHVVGGVWLPPEGWESPQDAASRHARHQAEEAARRAAQQAGLLCDCGQNPVQWQKKVRFPNPHTILMCDGCKGYEVELYGQANIEPYQPPDSGDPPCPANAVSAAVAVNTKSPTPAAKQPRAPLPPSATNGRRG